ncbi:MAG: trehalose monomycolate/heme transporter [Trebonia sp.]|nr:trehalose monomycolate/heme transporter [Trebonia sp.]
MFEAWGRGLYRARRLTLLIALLFAVGAGVWGTGVFGKLNSGNTFTPPNSQSSVESNLAGSLFGRNGADVVVLFHSAAHTVADPVYRQAVAGYLAALPAREVTRSASYWTSGQPDLASADRHSTYAVLQLAGGSDQAREGTYKAIKADFPTVAGTPGDGITAQVGGTTATEVAINSEVSANIARAESISFPVLLILLVIIFGSVMAAIAPLAIGGLAILGSFTVLRLLTLATTVSVYSVNITTIMGLGLGIDYGLFIVTRFREELRRQALLAPETEVVERAVARTVATAGRTVLVSGVTVALALCGLMLFQPVFLRSMGYGGVATVAVDVIAALTVLPALLAVLGHRVNALAVRKSVRADAVARPEKEGGWYRLAHAVMRRPVVFAGVIVVVLLALGAPFLRISWGGTDASALPASSTVRQVQGTLTSEFPANSTNPIEAVVTGVTSQAQLTAYTAKVGAIPGVTGVQATARHGTSVRLDVGYTPRPDSPQARQIVTSVRALAPPPHASVLVGGTTAMLVDELSSLGATLPWMALLTAVATFVLLFLAFGSVVLPVKAIVMNILSLSATFGVIVWVFQWGHLSGLLGFTATGSIDPTMPILLLAIVFGLSMDYEVFLLSRIRERYDETGDNTAAVAAGLQRTGGLITSLALLLVIVVALFSASSITFLKLLGVGMIVALIVDATVVRILLVPATMRLLGRANWWAPGPLRRLYSRYGVSEAEKKPSAPVQV